MNKKVYKQQTIHITHNKSGGGNIQKEKGGFHPTSCCWFQPGIVI